MRRVLVWDLVVRLFHVLLIVGFATAYWVAKFLGEHSGLFPYHMMIGLTLAGIVLFRLAWGLVGTKWARLSTLFHGPRAHLDYLRGLFNRDAKRYAGHNPASSLAIVVILVLVLALGATGYLMSLGNEGLKKLHELLANLLLAVAIAHIGGVLLHTMVHRDDIILSMVDGRKAAPEEDAIPGPAPFAALLLLAWAGFLFGALAANYDPATRTTRWPLLGGEIRLSEGESQDSDARGTRERGEAHERHEEDD